MHQEKTLSKSLASFTEQGNIEYIESNSNELAMIDTECMSEYKTNYCSIT